MLLPQGKTTCVPERKTVNQQLHEGITKENARTREPYLGRDYDYDLDRYSYGYSEPYGRYSERYPSGHRSGQTYGSRYGRGYQRGYEGRGPKERGWWDQMAKVTVTD